MKPVLRCVLMLIGLVAGGAQATHAAVITDFTGAFAVGNWTTDYLPGDGYVDTSSAPTSILIASSANSFAPGTVFRIVMPYTGTVSFDWSFSTSDVPAADPFSFGIDGTLTQLSSDSGGTTQSGSQSVSLYQYDLFMFHVGGDATFGRSQTTITNFSVSYADSGAVPEPTSMAIFGLGALGMAYRQRRKNKS